MNKHGLFFYMVLFTGYATCVEFCNLRDGGYGKCIPINECPSAMNLVMRARTDSSIANYLRSLRCEPNSNVLKVCCSDCFTPEGKQGTCMNITQCPSLQNLITKDINYVMNSICLSGPYDVCCGPAPTAIKRGHCQSQITAFPPDLTSGCCGIEAEGQSKIVGGTSTGIDQYPWLVLLEYQKNNKILLLCGGALISNKYVLTAAHCAPDYDRPVSVRLGEYDITNPGEDCVNTPAGGVDCSSPAISIRIKEIIKHPEYDAEHKRNDIALIRLDGEANYTDFIRPICLPTSDVSTSDQLSDLKLDVAGWGKISWDLQNSALKQHVKLPMVDMQSCQNMYNARIRPEPQLWSKQLCAGGEIGKDSCNGDSGGPLMLETSVNTGQRGARRVFTAEGIVSFGPRRCGTLGIPGVYTKVHSYNTWIRRNIRP